MAALSCGGQCPQVIGSVAKLRQSGRQPKFTHEIRYAFGYGRGDGHPECLGDRSHALGHVFRCRVERANQSDSAQDSVMETLIAAHDGDGVRGPEPHADGNAACKSRQQHLSPCIEVVAIGDSAPEVANHAPDAVESERLAERLVPVGEVALDAVAKGIDACGRGQPTREGHCQLGVEHRQLRHEMPRAHAHRRCNGIGMDPGRRRCFATRPRRCWDHDQQRGGTMTDVRHAGVIGNRTSIGGQQGDHLGCVDHRAAAHGDHAVARVRGVRRGTGIDVGEQRIFGDAVEQQGRHRVTAGGYHLGRETGRDESLVGDEQRAPHAEALQFGGKSLDRTCGEQDSRQHQRRDRQGRAGLERRR